MEHFSRFVQPGFRRIASPTGLAGLRVSAYYGRRSQRLVVVLINTSASDTLTQRSRSRHPGTAQRRCTAQPSAGRPNASVTGSSGGEQRGDAPAAVGGNGGGGGSRATASRRTGRAFGRHTLSLVRALVLRGWPLPWTRVFCVQVPGCAPLGLTFGSLVWNH